MKKHIITDPELLIEDIDGSLLEISLRNSGLGLLTIWVHQDEDLCGVILQQKQVKQLRDKLTEILDCSVLELKEKKKFKLKEI